MFYSTRKEDLLARKQGFVTVIYPFPSRRRLGNQRKTAFFGKKN